MNHTSHYVCVITSKVPPPAIGSSQNTEAAQILDPFSGSILSANAGSASLKVGSGIGIQSFAPIPLDKLGVSYTNHEMLYISYGGKNKDDMYAQLVVQGSTSSPKWRCRVPEYLEGGIIVSPCAHYIVGAGKSGNCYCWSLLQDGELLKTWSAHYRAVQTIVFSDCGSFLITGGSDGIVNMWSLMDIVSEENGPITSLGAKYGSSSMKPVRTWSEHQLPVTSLHALPSSRVVSTSQDRHVIIMELFSGLTLAKIQMPSAVSVVTADASGHRLFIGSIDGTIYCIDIDSYAIATTAESATVTSNTRKKIDFRGPSLSGSLLEETILGDVKPGASYFSELRGHEAGISSLALVEDQNSSLLVSGDIIGTICIWDLRFRICVRTLHPWSSSGVLGTEKVTKKCPCSNILVILRDSIESKESSGVFVGNNNSSNSSKQNPNCLVNLIKPLQRFAKSDLMNNNKEEVIGYLTKVIVPQNCSPFSVEILNEAISKRIQSESYSKSHHAFKKRRLGDAYINEKEQEEVAIDEKEVNTPMENEIQRLNVELIKANATIERWQKVNTKLALKLKKSNSN